MKVAKRRLESVHVVRTPELVEFDFPLAGLMSRTLAWLVDLLVSTAIAAVASLALTMGSIFSSGLAMALVLIAWFLVNWGYFAFAEYRFAGRTVGKRLLGLRTLQVSGVRVGFYHAVLRNLVRALDHLPLLYLAGGALTLLSAKFQRLGDLAAGTVVVRDRRAAMPAGLQRPADALQLLGGDKRLLEKVAKASVDERELLTAAVLRREELAMNARLTLFAKLSGYAQEQFGIDKPDHLSDEKFAVALVGLMIGEKAPAAGSRPR
jgi:uncharacterized RDD family membrane protein YckC